MSFGEFLKEFILQHFLCEMIIWWWLLHYRCTSLIMRYPLCRVNLPSNLPCKMRVSPTIWSSYKNMFVWFIILITLYFSFSRIEEKAKFPLTYVWRNIHQRDIVRGYSFNFPTLSIIDFQGFKNWSLSVFNCNEYDSLLWTLYLSIVQLFFPWLLKSGKEPSKKKNMIKFLSINYKMVGVSSISITVSWWCFNYYYSLSDQ